MATQNVYKPLFNFQILHHYFLDEGTLSFDDANPSPKEEEQLEKNRRQYNVADFFKISLTERTKQKLNNWKAQYVQVPDGFKVFLKSDNNTPTKPFIPFPTDLDKLYFDFVVRINDQYFENYTDININKSKILFISNQELHDTNETEDTSVEVIRFSNFGGNPEDIKLDLSEDFGGLELQGAYAVFRIYLEGEGDDIDLTDGSGNFASETPLFKMIFENRRTKWRYIPLNGDGSGFQTNKKPLTKNGYIKVKNQGKSYPNPDPKVVTKEGSIYYSDVYI